jgi:hypothetical protein
MAAPNLNEACGFLALLAPGERVTFQAFDDNRKRKDRHLSRILHGTLAEHAAMLAELNERGAGVYWMVNSGDCKGRKGANVIRVRAIFLDLDGSPLEPVKAALPPPHCILESSPDRWHAYWRVEDCPLERFTPTQQAMAAYFKGDVTVHDLPRVMRLPGFDHRKGEPFRSRITTVHNAPPYTLADLIAAFDLDAPKANAPSAPAPNVKQLRRTLPHVIPEGERNTTLLSLAAGLVRKGFDLSGVVKRLQRINAERCEPPLCAAEVEIIGSRAIGYGSDGFVMLPHKLCDSPEWKALAPAAHDIIMLALRRFDGTNNGNIALTFDDFAGCIGFAKPDTFREHRNAVVRSGILLQTCAPRNTQRGRKPGLYAIASQWLPDSFAKPKKRVLRQTQKGNTYIDKQALEILGLDGAGGSTKTNKAA